MNFKKLFFIFLLWRLFDFLIILLVPQFIPYLGFFPNKEILSNYYLPSWITSLANFDGVHYLSISQQGYLTYEQAFFPLYPFLIRFFTPVFFKNSLLTGLIISNLSFLFGLWFFSKYLKLVSKNFNQLLVISTILVFPTSFFFGALYTEGLFFFLTAACLYFLKKRHYLLAAIFTFFASLTKIIGVFLIIPIIFSFLNLKKICFSLDKISRSLFLIFSPFLGLSTYMFYLWKTTGDPLFFFHAQPSFGANRSTKIILLPQVYFRYLKIFFSANFNFQYFIAVFEFFIFTLVFTILILDLLKTLKIKISPLRRHRLKDTISVDERLSLNLFSFANLLLPSFTGTFTSIPRYTLFSLSFFLFLAEVKNNKIKILVNTLFLIFHIITLGFFIQGYFVS